MQQARVGWIRTSQLRRFQANFPADQMPGLLMLAEKLQGADLGQETSPKDLVERNRNYIMAGRRFSDRPLSAGNITSLAFNLPCILLRSLTMKVPTSLPALLECGSFHTKWEAQKEAFQTRMY